MIAKSRGCRTANSHSFRPAPRIGWRRGNIETFDSLKMLTNKLTCWSVWHLMKTFKFGLSNEGWPFFRGHSFEFGLPLRVSQVRASSAIFLTPANLSLSSRFIAIYQSCPVHISIYREFIILFLPRCSFNRSFSQVHGSFVHRHSALLPHGDDGTRGHRRTDCHG